MRKMPIVVLASSALVGFGAAYFVTHAKKSRLVDLPPNVFVSADQQGLVVLPEEPKPLPPEAPSTEARLPSGQEITLVSSPSLPILMQPEPMPASAEIRGMTVSLRQPVEAVEEETLPPPTPMPDEELGVVIARPEEAPPSPEVIAMPTEEPSGHYFPHRPQYFPPSPDFPLSRELATMEANEAAAGNAVPASVPPPVPVVPGPLTDGPTPVQSGPLPLPAMVFTVSRPRISAHSEVSPLTGAHPCSLENKVELMLPDAVRQQMGKKSRVLYVAMAPDQKCLWVYTSGGVDQLVRQLERPSSDDEQTICNLRVCLSRLQCVSANSDGVFSLPVELVEAAKLEKDVILIGVRDHLELWGAKSWQQYSTDPNRRMTELLKSSEEFTDQPSHMTPERVHGGIQ